MKADDYPQIKALEEIYRKHHVKITISKNVFLGENKDYPAVKFSLGKDTFDIYVADDIEDIKFGLPLLNFCLVLRELEYYHISDDYILWCIENYLKPENIQVLAYFRSLGTTYRDIEKILGSIDSQISDWDFEMNAGAGYYIRKDNKFNP